MQADFTPSSTKLESSRLVEKCTQIQAALVIPNKFHLFYSVHMFCVILNDISGLTFNITYLLYMHITINVLSVTCCMASNFYSKLGGFVGNLIFVLFWNKCDCYCWIGISVFLLIILVKFILKQLYTRKIEILFFQIVLFLQ